MKHSIKKSLLCGLSVAATLCLCACNPETPISFDAVRPWHDGDASYERLEYSVTVYDTTAGYTDETRVKIADGELIHTLVEQTRTDGPVGYSSLDMSFFVKYNDNAPQADRGLTDSVSSSTEFQTDSLATSRMTKKVELAPRADTTDLSYEIVADYFGTHSATVTEASGEHSVAIPQSPYNDNEMMFHLARATDIGINAVTNFNLSNIYESYITGGFKQYAMTATGAKAMSVIDMDEWVKAFGVEAATADDGTTTYPVSCYKVDIARNEERHGPPYTVYYTEKPFTENGKEHKKIPIKIVFNEYGGSKLVRQTEYMLTSCSFEKD